MTAWNPPPTVQYIQVQRIVVYNEADHYGMGTAGDDIIATSKAVNIGLLAVSSVLFI
jgi:hypothetical protein